MTSVVQFKKSSQFQEYEVTGVTNRMVDDHISVTLVKVGDVESIGIDAAILRSDLVDGQKLNVGDSVRARLSLHPKIQSQSCQNKVFKIESLDIKSLDGDVAPPQTHGDLVLRQLKSRACK